MSELLVTQGQHNGRRFNLRDCTRIGRALDNDIVLADHLVSRYHAEIVRQGPHFHVQDMGSKNGLQVNGASVAEKRLCRGDRLQIGATTFIYQTLGEARSARFSDLIVHLDARPDEALKVLDGVAISSTVKDETLGFLAHLGILFECEADELPEALNTLLRQIMAIFGAGGGAILLRNASGEAMPLVASAADRELRVCHDTLQLVLSEGKAAITACLPSGGEEAQALPRKAMLVPLTRRDRIFGVLFLDRPEGREMTLEELGRLQALSRVIAGAVHHAIHLERMVLAQAGSPSLKFVGASAATDHVRTQIERVAVSDAAVLITGETGTGKELVARAIHAASARAGAAFIPIDCSSIPASLIESELFGHEAGAFTGADRLKRGRIEMAEGGTLFLDEIGEMQIDLQPKLLRFLEEQVFYRVGGVRPIQSDVRILAATNRKLEQAVLDGRFRQDLFFRLNVMTIELPPLRQRPDDIRPLAEHFAPSLATHLGKPYLGMLDEAWALLEQYRWPGNVRELRHALERALILSDDGILRPEHFQLTRVETPAPGEPSSNRSIRTETQAMTHAEKPVDAKGVPPSLATVETEAIRRALRYAKGNRQRAAQILKIHRNTLAKKIQEYGLEV